MAEAGAQASVKFGLFVSSVEGRPVARFGSKLLIGAERSPDNPNKITYRTKDIVPLPVAEAARYTREYSRLIAEGDLVEHTEAEWQQQTQHRAEAGAPREKLKTGREPDQPTAKDADNAPNQGRSELG